MRVAFTIIFNGAHHLLHNGFVNRMPAMFDHWVLVEGLSHPGGSTAWCNKIPGNHSTDGTIEIIKQAQQRHKNIRLVLNDRPWISKDEMVNRATDCIRTDLEINRCNLWEIDADEQWEGAWLSKAEDLLDVVDGKTGEFLCNYYVGKDLFAVGEWGEGNRLPYRRLWKWSGQDFKSHEPPELVGGNGRTVFMPIRFNHYAYYFESDVVFKENYYSGHVGIHSRWRAIQKEIIPANGIPISRLISGLWGRTKTRIVRGNT